MHTLDTTPNTLRVSQLLAWQRDGSLNLHPQFQRRSVWRPGARSYLIDTIVRGLPVPLIFIRERLDLSTQQMKMDVVDGQQRLRTLFAFIDEHSLSDFDPGRDRFTVKKAHNPDIAGRPFAELDPEWQERLLNYRFSVQTLPTSADDRDVLQIFARLNSTGLRLNNQELRNAAWFGVFKTLMYSLSYEQLERWQDWKLFGPDQIARMDEVEFTSDLVYSCMNGISSKSKVGIDRMYKDYDESFAGGDELGSRFRRVMDTIDDKLGRSLPSTVFDRQMYFYTLFMYVYDRLFTLASPLKKTTAKRLPSSFPSNALTLSKRFKDQDIPKVVAESVTGAATDAGRRRSRYEFSVAVLNGQAGN